MTATKHLDKILAKIDRLLEMAEKRTQGVVRYDEKSGSIFAGETEVAEFVLSEDAYFLTSCAGNAEAGWRATRAAIENWRALIENAKEFKADNGCAASVIYHFAKPALEAIAAAWPIELLD